ncbi:MAG TPA: hypothetical protein VJZ71_21785 [Phycisphaerae bacterium]|nr:hypothetical protein [Phycisphaerae bacterium]
MAKTPDTKADPTPEDSSLTVTRISIAWRALNETIRYIPEVGKYFLAVVGLSGAASLCGALFLYNWQVAFIAGAVTLVGALLIFVFSSVQHTQVRDPILRRVRQLGLTLIATVVVGFAVFLVALFIGLVFSYPREFSDWLKSMSALQVSRRLILQRPIAHPDKNGRYLLPEQMENARLAIQVQVVGKEIQPYTLAWSAKSEHAVTFSDPSASSPIVTLPNVAAPCTVHLEVRAHGAQDALGLEILVPIRARNDDPLVAIQLKSPRVLSRRAVDLTCTVNDPDSVKFTYEWMCDQPGIQIGSPSNQSSVSFDMPQYDVTTDVAVAVHVSDGENTVVGKHILRCSPFNNTDISLDDVISLDRDTYLAVGSRKRDLYAQDAIVATLRVPKRTS